MKYNNIYYKNREHALVQIRDNTKTSTVDYFHQCTPKVITNIHITSVHLQYTTLQKPPIYQKTVVSSSTVVKVLSIKY